MPGWCLTHSQISASCFQYHYYQHVARCQNMSVFKKNLSSFGAVLTVQWLGLCTSSAGDVVQSLVGELGSYLLRGAPLTKKKKNLKKILSSIH